MRHLMHTTKRRLARLLGACALLTVGIGAPALILAGTAQAAPCGTATAAGTSCTLTGTLSLTSGSLNLTSPSALGWGATLSGLDQVLVDTTTADQSYLINDATGTAIGWHVTAAATTFTTGGGTPSTLANAGTFATNGSATSITATTAPTAACLTGSTCTPPTNTTTYPVAITTAATAPTAATIYDTSVGTGLGSNTIGIGTNPVAWWLSVPSNTLPGTYTSTVTLQIIAAP